MGLTGALSNALSGLSVTQSGLEVVARNIANAGTDGYTRKTLSRQEVTAGAEGLGVRAGAVARAFDSLLAGQLRTELGQSSYLSVLSQSLGRLDGMFGTPGGSGALDTAINDFTSALSGLVDQPESAPLRANAIDQAQVLAGRLNALSKGVQSLRQDADNGIAASVDEANSVLDRLAEVNGDLNRAQSAGGSAAADLLDERDRLLADLSSLMSVKFQEQDGGAVRVFTGSGHLLVDGSNAMSLAFAPTGAVGPTTLYDGDPAKSGLGTVLLDNGTGQRIDLFKDGGLEGGAIDAYRELRDDKLVAVQAQLDALAGGLAKALSTNDATGAAVTVGAAQGFDLDLAAMQPGDTVTLSYVETATNTTHKVTLVAVTDPSLLPLDDAVTPETGDTVIGLDLSGGVAAAAASLNAALGGAVTASNPSGTTLRLLDDGAAGTTDIAGLDSHFTATALADQGLGLPLFSDGAGGKSFSGALEGGGQIHGFAGRISVNPLVKADDSSLVVYSTSPTTSLADQARPADLLARLSDATYTFSPSSGLGTPGAPLKETIGDFARRIVAEEARNAASADAGSTAQAAVTRSLQDRYDSKTGVDIDAELSQLIALQTSYAANARVISVVQDLLALLVQS